VAKRPMAAIWGVVRDATSKNICSISVNRLIRLEPTLKVKPAFMFDEPTVVAPVAPSHHQQKAIRPWCKGYSSGQVVMSVKFGAKPIEFENGIAGRYLTKDGSHKMPEGGH